MMLGLHHFQYVFYFFDILEGNWIPSHQVFGDHLFGAGWRFLDENGHLLASSCTLIQRPRKLIPNQITNHNSNINRHKKRNNLRRLHHNNRQTIRHPGIPRQHTANSQYHEVFGEIVNVILGVEVFDDGYVLDYFAIELADGAADDHAW